MSTGMTSPRIAAAVRRNARISTGPRTASGKKIAARNAFRHGLSIPVLADPALAEEIAELADRFAKGATDPETRELAVSFAAAQVDVRRVRHARHLLTARPASGAEPRWDRMAGELRQLVALARYERQAMWRRKLATRAWQAALFRKIMATGLKEPASGKASNVSIV